MAGSSDFTARQSSCFYGYMTSPSWLPLHKDHQYSGRFHLLGDEAAAGTRGRWWNLFRRLKKEGKATYGYKPRPLTFHYDIVSYSKNFDDGCCWPERDHHGLCRQPSDQGYPIPKRN